MSISCAVWLSPVVCYFDCLFIWRKSHNMYNILFIYGESPAACTCFRLNNSFLDNRPHVCRPHDVSDWIVVLKLAWTCGFLACKCSALSKKTNFIHNRPHACRSCVLCDFLLLFIIVSFCLFGEHHTAWKIVYLLMEKVMQRKECTIVYLLMKKVTQHVHVSD